MKKIRLAISAGDYNGIGPEIILKSLADSALQEICEYSISGTEAIFQKTFDSFSPSLRNQLSQSLEFTTGRLLHTRQIQSVDLSGWNPGQPSRVSGGAAYVFLEEAFNLWQRGGCDCIVTAPVMKETFFPEGQDFSGQTELIAHMAGSGKPLMIMVAGRVRIALVTTHIPVRAISGFITVEMITEKGTLLFESLKRDFGIDNPAIAVSALNPHAGESGKFGDEEKVAIYPALERLKTLDAVWSGPHPADSLFMRSRIEQYDGILALYHDQGLIPFKMYSERKGVNFTAGLPVVRTSPDHGTAMDIAGKGIAEAGSFKEALYLAVRTAQRRIAHG
ncbi:4-hydroxythreonine-4-phosphate dehydrogenase PdxA [candidate division KSB1 bacterium]